MPLLADQSALRAPICSAGHGHGPIAPLARRALRKVNRFTSPDRHVEMASSRALLTQDGPGTTYGTSDLTVALSGQRLAY